MHMDELKNFDKRFERNETLLHKKHIDSFAVWLDDKVKQLFYSRENETSNWYVALQAPPRGFHALNMEEETTYGKTIPFDVSQIEGNNDEDENYARIDVEGILCAT
ncbi:Uncharacterized protein Adt_05366 [Abeliophyllum distichum]|uniref:Uncharacterized protein n=1 Tax=Abeliophyllum distichum TaxID=126358 RepID=A0ABD1V3W5_9LAMI